jgi:hypothetical protein
MERRARFGKKPSPIHATLPPSILADFPMHAKAKWIIVRI